MYKFKEFKEPEILTNHLNLGGENPSGEKIGVTSLYFTRGGKPWIGIMGEFHFSRCKRKYWYQELCKMKAGGITIAATYLFWIYHEEIEGEFVFSGDNDIRAFVSECRRAGLDVVLRIGPWAHGECRNGGFPDWLSEKGYPLRTNHPAYLKKVQIWYEKIAEQVNGLFYKDGGNIIAVQLDNELTDDAEHLAKLKGMAVENGMIAPIYTVTGWNSTTGARIPVDEVVPVFGGYCDAPWDAGTGILPPSNGYFFNQMRNDSAIGTDLIAQISEDGWLLPYERYPYATCEIGGGLHATHHRRYIIKGMDIYALSLIKLGSGNNLIGYYMYHGGTNQLGKLSTLQETRATGYANDYPALTYDFQAPLSEYGEVREHYRLLNLLHLFVQDHQEGLAGMITVDARESVKREDVTSLRYCMRTDGKSGFVFISHYQRLSKLADVKDVVIDTGSVIFPAIDVCGDICFFMPFRYQMGDCMLEYATAQPVCRAEDTWFFAEIPGIKAMYQLADGRKFTVRAGMDEVLAIDGIKIVTLTWEQACYLRRMEGRLYIGDECDLYFSEDELHAVQAGIYTYYYWDGTALVRESVGRSCKEPVLIMEEAEAPDPLPAYVGEMHIGGERKLTWQKLAVTGSDGFVEIDYVGDAAQLYIDGRFAADNYYCGFPWRVPADLLWGKECYLVVSEMRDDFYKEF